MFDLLLGYLNTKSGDLNLKTWLMFLVDCNRKTNQGCNWEITQSFLVVALKRVSKEDLEAVRNVFFSM